MADGSYAVRVKHNVMLKMRDGVALATDIYFPFTDEAGTDQKFPAILERTPYGKTTGDAPCSARFFASHGYVCLIQDCRGRFDSEGVHVSYFSEPEDGYDTIEWVARQPWCDGRVGTIGLSYGAAIQGSTGALAPPHLESMVPVMGFTHVASVRKRHGGAARLSTLIREFKMVIDSKEALSDPKLREYFIEAHKNMAQWLKALPLKRGHNPFSLAPAYEADIFDLMQKSEWDPLYEHVGYEATPYWDTYSHAHVHLVGGWYDSHALATVDSYKNLSERGRRVRLTMGPWKHGSQHLQSCFAGDVYFGPEAALDYDGFRLRWFDETLKNTFAHDRPPMRIFVMGGGSGLKTAEGHLDHGGSWRYEQQWPLACAQDTRFYLHSGGGLSEALAGSSEPTSYMFDPKNPVPTIGGPISSAEDVLPGGGFDQTCGPHVYLAEGTLPLSARHDVCVFQTEPLKHDLEVIGPLEVVLYASSDCVDTDFSAKLVDVYPPNRDYPTGYALNIQDGIIRARYRNRKEPPEFLQPHEVYEFRIVLFPTANLFKAGHRIRLDISSSNFPRFDVNPNTGEPMMANTASRVATNSIYHSPEYPSHILLPITSPRKP